MNLNFLLIGLLLLLQLCLCADSDSNESEDSNGKHKKGSGSSEEDSHGKNDPDDKDSAKKKGSGSSISKDYDGKKGQGKKDSAKKKGSHSSESEERLRPKEKGSGSSIDKDYDGKKGQGKKDSSKKKGSKSSESEERLKPKEKGSGSSLSKDYDGKKGQGKKDSKKKGSDSSKSKEHETSKEKGSYSSENKEQETPTDKEITTPAGSGTIGHCGTWGDGAYRGLDGQVHYAKTDNNVVLLYDCGSGAEENPEFVVECQRKYGSLKLVNLRIGSDDIIIDSSGIHVNNVTITLPYANGNINARSCGIYTEISTVRGISVTVNMAFGIHINLQKSYVTCGIVGGSKKISDEEWQQHFSSYIISDEDEKYDTVYLPSHDLGDPGRSYCKDLFETYFSEIDNLEGYVLICAHHYESCDKEDQRSCTCSTLIAAAKSMGYGGCSEQASAWRNDERVVCGVPECPETYVFSECAPKFPPACSNLNPVHEREVVASCTCPNGLVVDDIGGSDKCINIDDCPCFYDKVYFSGETRKGSCDAECTCSGGKWTCTEENCPGVCKVQNGIYVTTFDGMDYSLSGNCEYIIYKTSGIIILAEIHTPNAQSVTSLKSVTIVLNVDGSEHQFVIQGDTISNMDLIYHMSDKIYLKKHSDYTYMKLFNNQMEVLVQIHPTMQVNILVPFGHSSSAGLCGSYNQDTEDDLTNSNGIVESLAAVFADSWAQYSCPPVEQQACINLNNELIADEHCSELKNPAGKFAKCHLNVDYGVYYERCVSSTCRSEDVWAGLCSALENYVQACAKEGILLVDWRNEFCKKECKNNQVFEFEHVSCFPSCAATSHLCDDQGLRVEMCTCDKGLYLSNNHICVPKEDCDCLHRDGVIPAHGEIKIEDRLCKCHGGRIECDSSTLLDFCSGGATYVDCTYPNSEERRDLNCKNIHLPAFHSHKTGNCKPGCYCPDGMVKDMKGQCIPPDQCPCLYGGTQYESGNTLNISCRKCVCNKGKWDCTEDNCARTCNIHGVGHVASFDGMLYSFAGLCQYTLSEEENGLFRISVQSEPCCEEGLTCSRKVVIESDAGTITLQDGKAIADNSQDCSEEKKNYSITEVGLQTVVSLGNGVEVLWDKAASVTVKLNSDWGGKVNGLCGNNNGDKMDDLHSRNGIKESIAMDFGNSWKNDPSCQDSERLQSACDAKPNCKPWALRKCQILKENLFKDCHSKVDPTAYYEKCIEEACVCDMEGKYLGFCSSVALYAQACLEAGVCVNWRKPDLCPVYCDYYDNYGDDKWHYEPCGSPQMKTCSNQETFSKYSPILEGCYPRCSISEPYLDQNTKTCVRLSDCSCSYNGNTMAPNSMIVDECGKKCYCSKGNVKCEEPTEPSPSPSDGWKKQLINVNPRSLLLLEILFCISFYFVV